MVVEVSAQDAAFRRRDHELHNHLLNAAHKTPQKPDGNNT